MLRNCENEIVLPNCLCLRYYYILWIWQNTTQTSTCPACANTAALVPSDLMTRHPALTWASLRNDIRPHRFYFFYSSRIKVKQVLNPIKYLFLKLQIYHNYTHHYCTTGLFDLMQRYFNLGIIHGPSLQFKDKLSELPFKCDYWPILVVKEVSWILTKCSLNI